MAKKAKKDGLTSQQRAMKAEQAAISAKQIREIEREKKAKKKQHDAAALAKFEERCKAQQVKREERKKRVEELHTLSVKKRQIAKKYR